MDTQTILLLLLGLVLLAVGAEALVRGASRLAAAVGISPLVIGLTVVAFGTSAPELAVSLRAGLGGAPDIVIGNVVGSNIANVLLILGMSALVAPLVVAQQLVRLDVPLMIGASAAVLLMALDGRVGQVDGLLLFAAVIAYTTFAIRQSRKESAAVRAEYEREFGVEKRARRSPALDLGLVSLGLAMLVVGAGWLVDGAVVIARALGLSELIIGLTIVAVGTSLPELATSLVASFKGERDIAVGNIIGSNLFNILGILGLSSLLVPDGVGVAPAALNFDIPVMLAVAVACLPIFYSGYLITRWEGALFVAYFAAYIAYLVLGATDHDALPVFSNVMWLFVLPITATTLVILARRARRAQGPG
jgi:cation:H+ antiporter